MRIDRHKHIDHRVGLDTVVAEYDCVPHNEAVESIVIQAVGYDCCFERGQADEPVYQQSFGLPGADFATVDWAWYALCIDGDNGQDSPQPTRAACPAEQLRNP